MPDFDETAAVDQVCQRLALRFPTIPLATVQTTVHELHANLTGPVRNYVPLLVERGATDRLSAIVALRPSPEAW